MKRQSCESSSPGVIILVHYLHIVRNHTKYELYQSICLPNDYLKVCKLLLVNQSNFVRDIKYEMTDFKLFLFPAPNIEYLYKILNFHRFVLFFNNVPLDVV